MWFLVIILVGVVFYLYDLLMKTDARLEKMKNGFNRLVEYINQLSLHIEDEDARRKFLYECINRLLFTMKDISSGKQNFYATFIRDLQDLNKEWTPYFYNNGELTRESIEEIVETSMSNTKQGRINAGLDKEK